MLRKLYLFIFMLCTLVASAEADAVFKIITSIDELTDGEYLIVYNSIVYPRAMSNSTATIENSTNNGFKAVEIAIDNKTSITIPASDKTKPEIFTIKSSGIDKKLFTIQFSNGRYLFKENSCSLSDTEDVIYTYIDFSDNIWTIVPQKDSTSKSTLYPLGYSSEIFQCFSNVKAVSLFKKEVSKLPAPVLSFENVEGLVDMGAPLAIECKGAEKIYFTCNNSSPIEYLAPVPLMESGTYTAWGVDAAGNEGEKATVEITVMETTQSYRRVALASSICAEADFILCSYSDGFKILGKDGLVISNYATTCDAEIPGVDMSDAFRFNPTDGGYKIFNYLTNNYLTVNGDILEFNGTAAEATIFSLSMATDNNNTYYATIATADNSCICYDDGAGKFTLGTTSNIMVYRSDADLIEAPDLLYLHGTISTGDWNFAQPHENGFNENGKIIFKNVWIPRTAAGHFFFSTAKAPQSRSSEPDWSTVSAGTIYAPETTNTAVADKETVPVTTYPAGSFDSRPPHFKVDSGKEYSATLDFSGYDPLLTLEYTNDMQTPVAETFATDPAPVEYFNTQGIRIANPHGLTIVRRGSTVTKEIIP